MTNNNGKVYVVTHRHTSADQHGGRISKFDVLGVCKDLEEAKRIAWEQINETLDVYGSDERFEITYRPSDDQINRMIEMLDTVVYARIESPINGSTIVRGVTVCESKMT